MSLFCSIILMGFRHDHSLPPMWDLSPKANREVESDRRRHEPLKLRSTIIRGFLWIFGLLLLIAVIKGMETSPSLDRRIQNLDPFGVRGTADAQLQSAPEHSGPSTQTQETVTQICGHYRRFHNNGAYQAAQNRARIYECAVLKTQLVTWQQYSPEDPRAIAQIDTVKKKARVLLEKHYPRIPEACATALLGIGYIVISANPTAQESCTRTENSIEQAR